MADQSATGPIASFLALPAEIRVAIYESLFLGSTTRFKAGDVVHLRQSRHQIILTCRRCYAEARHLFYSHNIWSFDGETQIYEFLSRSRHGNIAPHVKHIQVMDDLQFRGLCTSLDRDSLHIFPSLETLRGHLDLFVELKHPDEVRGLTDDALAAWALHKITLWIWYPHHIADTVRQRAGLSVLLSVRMILRNAAGGRHEPRFTNPFTGVAIELPTHTLDVLVNLSKPEIIRLDDGQRVFQVSEDDLSIVRLKPSALETGDKYYEKYFEDLKTMEPQCHPMNLSPRKTGHRNYISNLRKRFIHNVIRRKHPP